MKNNPFEKKYSCNLKSIIIELFAKQFWWEIQIPQLSNYMYWQQIMHTYLLVKTVETNPNIVRKAIVPATIAQIFGLKISTRLLFNHTRTLPCSKLAKQKLIARTD